MTSPYAEDFTNEYGGPTEPQYLDPATEGYQEFNVPYRGNVPHGVDPSLYGSYVPDEDREGGKIELHERKEEPEPTPVRVVNTSPESYVDWSAGQLSVDTTVRRLVGRNPSRKTLKIRNLHPTEAFYVGRNYVSYLNGYPVAAAGGEFSITSTEDVWAVASNSALSGVIMVAIVEEFTVEVK